MPPTRQEERESRYHWHEIQLEDLSEYATEEPADPEVGERWYDAVVHQICIWDGLVWLLVPLD
jgi:hypothetical protein